MREVLRLNSTIKDRDIKPTKYQHKTNSMDPNFKTTDKKFSWKNTTLPLRKHHTDFKWEYDKNQTAQIYNISEARPKPIKPVSKTYVAKNSINSVKFPNYSAQNTSAQHHEQDANDMPQTTVLCSMQWDPTCSHGHPVARGVYPKSLQAFRQCPWWRQPGPQH